MRLTSKMVNIFHQQNKKSLRLIFFVMAVVTIIGFTTEMLQLFKRGEIIPAALDLLMVTISLTISLLLGLRKINVRVATVLFIYGQLLVAASSILYFGLIGDLDEKRYMVELLLHLIYIVMIGYLSEPKHCLYYGGISLAISIVLNIVYINDTIFNFLPIYIPILIGFPVGFYFLIKNTMASFSNNYLSKIALEKYAKNIQKQNNQIKQLGQFRKDLSEMIVHDLKNPLNIILNKTNNNIIQHSGKRMMNLILNLLDVEKYSDTVMKLNKNAFSIMEEINTIIKDMHDAADEQNISLNSIGDDYIVYADRRIVNRILENLLTNAINHSVINSQIDIKVSNYPEDKIKIEVINYGKHIPTDMLSSIFDKYSQLRAEGNYKKHNSGLGLTFCKIAVNAHRQEIVAKNIAGGVSFEFTLDIKSQTTNVLDIQPRNDLILTQAEKDSLLSYVNQLKKYQVHSATEILSIVEDIDIDSENKKNWKHKLKTAIFSANEILYLNLLAIIEK